MSKKKQILATIDIETLAFRHDRYPKAFCVGLYISIDEYHEFWGDDCIKDLVDFLQKEDRPLLIYAHNGGKFDFHYFLKEIDRIDECDILLIQSRIAKFKIGKCELRDSYLLFPFALSTITNQKIDIDYEKFEVEHREKHKKEILSYLKNDCVILYSALEKFREEYGDKLTIASCAMQKLDQIRKISDERDGRIHKKLLRGSQKMHDYYRPYYFGGRTQALRYGIFEGDFKYIDINSAYPFAMSAFCHPKNYENIIVAESGDDLDLELLEHSFVRILAISKGALCVRKDDGGVYFPDDEKIREYFTTGYELAVALKHKRVKIVKILRQSYFFDRENYSDYVSYFYNMKKSCKEQGDHFGTMSAKLMLNSAYGKFGFDPRNYKKLKMVKKDSEDIIEHLSRNNENWGISNETINDYAMLERDMRDEYIKFGYYCIATAISITGKVRSIMLDALCSVENPIYCDTDSIICEKIGELKIGKDLGEWDFENEGIKKLAVAGKKLYGYETKKGDKKVMAKGASSLDFGDLMKIASGEEIINKRDAPTFSKMGSHRFISRKIRKTGEGSDAFVS